MTVLRKFAGLALFLATALGARGTEVAILQNGFEIRHERREAAGDSIRLYLEAAPDSGFVDVPTEQIVEYRHEESPPPPAPAATPAPATTKLSQEEIDRLISSASTRHSIDPDLIASLIHAESNFNPHARSPKGAQGLMQLMPDTASRLGVNDAYEANANIDAGTRYLRQLLLRYDDDMVKALAAYNAGPERVERYRGIPPYRETHAYVARVINDFNRKKLAQQAANKEATSTPATQPATKKTAPKRLAAAHTPKPPAVKAAPSPAEVAITPAK